MGDRFTSTFCQREQLATEIDRQVPGKIDSLTGVEQYRAFLERIVAPCPQVLGHISVQLKLCRQRRAFAEHTEVVRPLGFTAFADGVDILPGAVQPDVIQIGLWRSHRGPDTRHRTKSVRRGGEHTFAKRTLSTKQPAQACLDRCIIQIESQLRSPGLRPLRPARQQVIDHRLPAGISFPTLQQTRRRHKTAIKALHDSLP